MSALAGRLLPLALLLVWEGLCRLGVFDARFVPGPWDILTCLADPGRAGELFGQAGFTLRRVVTGFFLGCGAGFCLGFACGAWRTLDETLAPVVELLRPVPSVAVIPVAVLLCGLGDAMNVAVAAFACAWPVFVAARDAVRAVPGPFADTARMAGLSQGRTLVRVALPACLPGAATGVRTALGIAMAVVVGSEMVASSDGLGHLAMAASFSRQQALVFACVLAMGLAGGVCSLALALLEGLAQRLRPGLLTVPGRPEDRA